MSWFDWEVWNMWDIIQDELEPQASPREQNYVMQHDESFKSQGKTVASNIRQ